MEPFFDIISLKRIRGHSDIMVCTGSRDHTPPHRKSDITKECSIHDNSTVLIMQGVKSSNFARFWIGRQTRSNSCQEVQRGQGSLGGKVRTHSHAVRRGLIRTKHFTTVRDLFGTVLEVIRKSPAARTQESELAITSYRPRALVESTCF